MINGEYYASLLNYLNDQKRHHDNALPSLSFMSQMCKINKIILQNRRRSLHLPKSGEYSYILFPVPTLGGKLSIKSNMAHI